jgi:hypothetical protein
LLVAAAVVASPGFKLPRRRTSINTAAAAGFDVAMYLSNRELRLSANF